MKSQGNSRIDHDRLFKELLETFFKEFMELFFPDVYQALDFAEIKFLQQELFTDVTEGDRHQVDILVETRLKGEDSIILIHVENQAQFQEAFPERMFIYFSRLYQKYRCRILPIALFSYDQIHHEKNCFQIEFPFLCIVQFNFHTVELKQHNWRDYIHSDNPVAAALLSKMGYNKEERVQVKLEFLRMLIRMELDPARMTLLTGFFETYLDLNREEERILEEAISGLNPKEADKMMELTTSWHEKGMEKGIRTGQAELILRQLTKKYLSLPEEIVKEIRELDSNRLSTLGEAILDFSSLDDLRAWLGL